MYPSGVLNSVKKKKEKLCASNAPPASGPRHAPADSRPRRLLAAHISPRGLRPDKDGNDLSDLTWNFGLCMNGHLHIHTIYTARHLIAGADIALAPQSQILLLHFSKFIPRFKLL